MKKTSLKMPDKDPSIHNRTYLGFHGTNAANTSSIRKDGFNLSLNIDDWLGKGVYFFVEGISCPKNASTEWAVCQSWDKKLKKNKYSDYHVLSANISGCVVLDFTNREELTSFNQTRELLIKKNDAYFRDKWRNSDKCHDKYLLDFIADLINLDIVIADLYIKTKFLRIQDINSRIPNSTVLCAKNKKAIDKSSISVVISGKCSK